MTVKEIRKINWNVTTAYFGFLFRTFFKRPFGYVIALLFIFYLSVVLMIVPAVAHLRPLAVWNSAAFNMPMFNLFFIAAIAASIAVILFRIGVEDGTELALSAKPITKGKRVIIKTITYIIIMLMINALALIVISLVKPIFGDFDILFNPTGITSQQYTALLLSVFIGNVVNMLLFGGIAVFISLVGGQVITMIGSVGIAFILCLLNFIYPLAVGKPKTILFDTYNTSINSISANTLAQIKGDDITSENVKTWASIQTRTQSSGEEINHMDTLEYWTKAESIAKINLVNYFDFGKQLSMLYTAFGLDSTKKENVEHGSIGLNSSYKYNIEQDTHVTTSDNIKNENYPVCVYSIYRNQGVIYPMVNILGGNTGLDVQNWTLISQATKSDFNSLTVLTKDPDYILSNKLFRNYVTIPYWTLSALNYVRDDKFTYQQAHDACKKLFDNYVSAIGSTEQFDVKLYSEHYTNPKSAAYIISQDDSGLFFDAGTWEDLKPYQRSYAISSIVMYWTIIAQEWQMNEISTWAKTGTLPESLTEEQKTFIRNDKFPYSSLTVKNWYITQLKDELEQVKDLGKYNIQRLVQQIFQNGVYCDRYQHTAQSDPIPFYVKPLYSQFEYCETFNNLYQFTVKPYFNVYALIAIWSSIAIALFASAIVIYKRTDFK